MDNFLNDPDCYRSGKSNFPAPDLGMVRQDAPSDLLKVLERGENLEDKHMIPAKAEARRDVGHWMAGESPAMERLRRIIIDVADTGADVLIVGETGTGKELVARSLHDQSRRWKNKFVAINCCALPESIMESELFGHEVGAFTGADRCRVGKFEFSNGGTLFLDEIDSMPVHLQAKLLRVLQERAVERVGSNEIIPLDIRVIASTKLDLKEACAQRKFREDLFYRLNVVNITLPPLRERREDIPLLFRYFALQAGSRYRRPVLELPENLIEDIIS
ncbi:MAG: sigma 54-interacting transcriptional regulator, partial [Nitrospinales bacterium]